MKKGLICVIAALLFGALLLAGCESGDAPVYGKERPAESETYEYHEGLTVAPVEKSDNIWGIVSEDGAPLAKFVKKSATRVRYLNNGNVFLTSVSVKLEDPVFDDFRCYMYCKGSGSLVPMPEPAYEYYAKLDYSDGLMIIYSNLWRDSGTRYFDEDGKVVLDLDSSNPEYAEVTWASGFEDGEAMVFFKGTDRNFYRVTIDKTGKWLTEPEARTGSRRFGDYDLTYDNPFN